ncbi:MAG: hypothetical protein N3E37_03275 [Candidatus Micrarchaeota archaeon]|nr:hypothetical protein [Candidatus Micrarchaeota archaeon]
MVDYLLNNFDKLPENLKAGIIFFLFENYRDFFKRSYQNLQSEELVLEERLVKLFDKLLDGINSNVEYYSLACAYACDRLSFAGLNSSLAFYSIDAKNNDQVSKLEHDLRSIGFTQIELNFLRLRLQSQNDKFSIRNFEFVVSSEGNVRIFRELRKEYFQKIEESNGSAAGHLHRTHGINFFGRYTFQLLKGQLETNYDNYVLVVSSNLYDSDHNGAFYNSNSEYEEFLRAGIGVVLIEASDESSFEKLVEDFSSRNKDKTAHALFLQFHGNERTAFFGTEKSESLTIDTTDKDLAQFIKSILAPSATIVFRSCSTGKELAGFIHVNTGNIKTIAPLGDTDIQDISNVQFQDKDKILKFSVVYYHPHVIFESNRSQ